MRDAPYDFDRPMPLGLRAAMLAAGLFCIGMPAYEFRQVFFQPSLLTLFFGGLMLGAWFVGGSFALAAITGAGQQWRFSGHRLTVANQTLLRQWKIEVESQSIADSTVRTVSWDSGPDTYSVVLKLTDGTHLETHGLDTADAAERYRQRILGYLGQV